MKKLLMGLGALLMLSIGAQAADLGSRQRGVEAPIVTAQPVAFTGVYIGAFWGYGTSNDNSALSQYLCPDCSSGKLDYLNKYYTGNLGTLHRDGMLVGAQLGYDWAMSERWRLGVLIDGAWSNIQGSGGWTGENTQLTSKLTWLANFDAKIGYLITSGAQIYALGGMSVGQVKDSISTFGGINNLGGCVGVVCTDQANQSASSTKVGWNLGAGFEAALDARRAWSVFIDYRHTWLPDSGINFAGYICDNPATAVLKQKNEFDVVRVGLNFHPYN
jgi:opacity protein-like surface antigen